MTKQLFAKQELKATQFFKAFEDRDNSEIKWLNIFTIANQIQSLELVIDIERAERVQAVAEVQNPMTELRDEFRRFVPNSIQLLCWVARTDARNEAVKIWDFGLKSKDWAIRIVENVIARNNDNPWIIEDRTSMESKVISVKFDSRFHAEAFIRRHAWNYCLSA